jgi:DNA modification methylase
VESLEDYWIVSDKKPAREFVSKVEELKKAKELDFDPTPGFGPYKKFFPKEAVAHPAKMNAYLLEYLITHYTEPGHVVLDPMGGTGSTGVVAALHGRDAVVVELEEKFTVWAEKAKARVDGAPTLNPKGSIRIVKGDARRLSELLGQVDEVVGSPPYNERYAYKDPQEAQKDDPTASQRGRVHRPFSQDPSNIGNLKHGEVDAVVSSPPYHTRTDGEGINRVGIPGSRGVNGARPDSMKYSKDRVNNIGEITALGTVDVAIGSPPYADSANSHDQGKVYDRMASDPASGRFGRKSHPHTAERYSDDPNNIGNLPPGRVDEVISSPPYSEGEFDYHHGIKPDKLSPNLKGRKAFEERRKEEYSEGNITTFKHGEIDYVVTSVPYQDSEAFQDTDFMVKIADEQDEKVRAGVNRGHPKSAFRTLKYKSGGHASQGHAASQGAEAEYMARAEAGRTEHPGNIGRLRSSENEVNEILTSPPYVNTVIKKQFRTEEDLERFVKGQKWLLEHGRSEEGIKRFIKKSWIGYPDNPDNIGNAAKESYLQAMLRVYSEMWKVLRPGGRAVIVVKPFSRDKKVVDLPWQTWLLLKKVGFEFEDVVKLRLKKLSFWRIIQYKKDPGVEQIRHEYCLVVRKQS